MNAKKYLINSYFKAHFRILKCATKYLINLIKSLLFKTEKYKKRKQESYQNLLDSIIIARAFRQFYRQSLCFIKSKDFKMRYKNHPYPPLLNPSCIDYRDISAKLAWELNLPLPPTYSYIYIRIYSCASGAMPVYLKKCGFYLTQSFQDSGFDDYATFLTIYDELRYGGGQNIVLDLLVHRFSEKFLYLVDKNVPCLIVVRDPIGIMKTLANHTGPAHNKIVHFNMDDDYKQILKQNLKYDNGITPQVGDFTHFVMQSHFATLESCLAHFKNNAKIIIDTADLSQDNVYMTLQNLSKKLNFTMPPKYELENIENTTLLLHWLNITLELPNDIEIIIATPFMINVYYDSNKYEILRGITTNDFKLYIAKNKAEILYQNTLLYKSCLEYLQGFCKNLTQMIKSENAKRMSEQDILRYFADNDEMRAKYKTMFDENLTTIKQISPQIIDSWRNYANFKNIGEKCNESFTQNHKKAI